MNMGNLMDFIGFCLLFAIILILVVKLSVAEGQRDEYLKAIKDILPSLSGGDRVYYKQLFFIKRKKK